MHYFLKEFTEPIAYFIYCIVLRAVYNVKKEFKYKLLSGYYATASVLLIAAYIQNELKLDNNWNYNLLFPLCICMFSYYYYSLTTMPYKKRFIVNCCITNMLFFLYVNIFEGQFTYNYHNYLNAFVFISIVIFSFFYFQDVLLNITEESILHKFDFWLVSANLIYFLGAFIVILFYAYADKSSRSSIWIVQSMILFISSLIALNGYFVVARNNK